MGALRGLKLVSSLSLLLLMINYLGADDFSDDWFLAVYIYSAINMFVWGPFNELFRGKFLKAKMSSQEIIELLTTINYMNLVFSIFSLIFIVIAANTNASGNLLFMLALLIPLLTAQQMTACVTAILNCDQKYIVPEVLVVLAQILAVAIFILVFPHFQLLALIMCQAVIVIIPFCYSIFWLRKTVGDACFNVGKIRARSLPFFLVGVIPLTITYGAGVALGLFERFIGAELGTGILTLVVYAILIKSSAQAIFTSFILSLVLPTLHIGRDINFSGNQSLLNKSKGLMMAIMALLVICITFIVTVPYVGTLFSNLSQDHITQFFKILPMYMVAIMPVIMFLFYGLPLASLGKEKVYALIGLVMLLIQGLLLAVFYRYTILGFPWALFLAGLIGFSSCYLYAKCDLRGLYNDIGFMVLISALTSLVSSGLVDTGNFLFLVMILFGYLVAIGFYMAFLKKIDKLLVCEV